MNYEVKKRRKFYQHFISFGTALNKMSDIHPTD